MRRTAGIENDRYFTHAREPDGSAMYLLADSCIRIGARLCAHIVSLEHQEFHPGVRAAALDREALFGGKFNVVDVAADADDVVDVAVRQADPARLVGQRGDRLGECRRCGG